MNQQLIRENVPLAPLTTLGIGGPARFLVEASEQSDVAAALEFARQRACPVFILGGGSNIVVSDAGFPGLVLRIALRGIDGISAPFESPVTASAGEPWDAFVEACVERNLAGIECLSGIPGTVGGTPVQNVGAYGQEVSEVVTSVRVFDRNLWTIREVDRTACGFGYRSSVFNTTERDRYVVLAVRFALRRNAPAHLVYGDLARWFAAHAGPVSLAEVRQAVVRIRAAKAMILLPGDPDSLSAGSFFKNPVVTREGFDAVADAARKLGHNQPPPAYSLPSGNVKVPAAWLIENAGFCKGYRRGRAGISTRHTLALVNLGGATARAMLELAWEIRSGVRDAFGVELVPEPVFVGFERSPAGVERSQQDLNQSNNVARDVL